MLGRERIKKELGKSICIYPFKEEKIKDNSVNLTASKFAWTLGNNIIYYTKDNNDYRLLPDNIESSIRMKKEYKKGTSALSPDGNSIFIFPHSSTLIETEEVIAIGHRIGGTLHSKTSVTELGVGHIGTMLGPNFCGNMLITLHNVTNELISLPIDQEIVSVIFYYLTNKEIHNNGHEPGLISHLAKSGIQLNSVEENELNQDWKHSFKLIQKKMIDSDSFKSFKANKEENSFFSSLCWKIIFCLICISFLASICIFTYTKDSSQNKQTFHMILTVSISIIIGPIVTFFINKVLNK